MNLVNNFVDSVKNDYVGVVRNDLTVLRNFFSSPKAVWGKKEEWNKTVLSASRFFSVSVFVFGTYKTITALPLFSCSTKVLRLAFGVVCMVFGYETFVVSRNLSKRVVEFYTEETDDAERANIFEKAINDEKSSQILSQDLTKRTLFAFVWQKYHVVWVPRSVKYLSVATQKTAN